MANAVGVTFQNSSGQHVHLEPEINGPPYCSRWEWRLTISTQATRSYWTSGWSKLFVDDLGEAQKEVTRQINLLVKALGLKKV